MSENKEVLNKDHFKDRGGRVYNGLPSDLMNEIYDQLIMRDKTIIDQRWWSMFSLYLARSCGVIEARRRDRLKGD